MPNENVWGSGNRAEQSNRDGRIVHGDFGRKRNVDWSGVGKEEGMG